MRISRPASHFGSAHAMAVIFQFCYRRFLDWFGEGRPAAAVVFMAWKPLKDAVEIPAQDLTAPDRTGFTVVEWGGSQVR